ncbi:Fis family transcriptional regulator (plasmid) [Paraburkholderia kururiensis]|uniref:hypothetical protein n=1 Tax=Paraburkholderia kururiensis TaxID=984307 RepID=UPI0039A4F052
MARQSTRGSGKTVRLPLTRDMLLPLPTARVQALSLENHLALTTVRAHRGGPDQIYCLIRIVYLAYFMRGETVAGADEGPYRQAEAALDACMKRMEQGGRCMLLEEEQAAMERVLLLHDQQLAATSKVRFLKAWEQMQHFAASEKLSPIPSTEA